MKVYSAENAGGEILFVLGAPGYTRKDFEDDLLLWVGQMDGDEQPHTLDLFEWPDIETAGAWLAGASVPEGESWTSLARKARFAELRYVYPGEHVIVAPDSPHERGPSLRVVESDLDGYERGDPKRTALERLL